MPLWTEGCGRKGGGNPRPTGFRRYGRTGRKGFSSGTPTVANNDWPGREFACIDANLVTGDNGEHRAALRCVGVAGREGDVGIFECADQLRKQVCAAESGKHRRGLVRIQSAANPPDGRNGTKDTLNIAV